MNLNEIINEFFIKPIISPEIQGYNLINTSVFIILLIISCFIIYTFLKNKIDFNEKFLIALIPYILIGVNLRVIMHQIEAGLLIFPGIIKTANPLELGFWFFTPGVWILTFLIVLVGLLINQIIKKDKKTKNYKILFIFGSIISTPLLIFNFLNFNNWLFFIITLIIITITTLITCFFIKKFTNYKITNSLTNIFIVLGQSIDGIASVTAITFFNFSEQHVVSNFIINIHPILFVLIKLILAVLICYSLDDYVKEKPNSTKLINYAKIIIAILGLAVGLASLIKLGLV